MSNPDLIKTRAWLVAMTKQGEDAICRGAVDALAAFDMLMTQRDWRLREQTPVPTHAYVPHPKYPWFCKHCGYPEHERLKHTATPSPDLERLSGGERL